MSEAEPPSIGRAPDRPTATNSATDPALVRLHDALKQLDGAIHDALRALDVALGREPTSGPPETLPYRELGRLKLHLESAVAEPTDDPERDLGDMALDWSDQADAGE